MAVERSCERMEIALAGKGAILFLTWREAWSEFDGTILIAFIYLFSLKPFSIHAIFSTRHRPFSIMQSGLDLMPLTGVTKLYVGALWSLIPSFHLFAGCRFLPSKLRNTSCPRKRRFEWTKVSYVSKSGWKKTFRSQEMSVQVHKKTVHHDCINIRPNYGESKSLPLVTITPRLAHTQPDYLPPSFPCLFFSFCCCESCIYRCAFLLLRFQISRPRPSYLKHAVKESDGHGGSSA